MVIITHDEEVAQLADRIIRMEDGILVSEVRDGKN
jgi:ABC-type lipoprotein export system ATPase subunit